MRIECGTVVRFIPYPKTCVRFSIALLHQPGLVAPSACLTLSECSDITKAYLIEVPFDRLFADSDFGGPQTLLHWRRGRRPSVKLRTLSTALGKDAEKRGAFFIRPQTFRLAATDRDEGSKQPRSANPSHCFGQNIRLISRTTQVPYPPVWSNSLRGAQKAVRGRRARKPEAKWSLLASETPDATHACHRQVFACVRSSSSHCARVAAFRQPFLRISTDSPAKATQ